MRYVFLLVLCVLLSLALICSLPMNSQAESINFELPKLHGPSISFQEYGKGVISQRYSLEFSGTMTLFYPDGSKCLVQGFENGRVVFSATFDLDGRLIHYSASSEATDIVTTLTVDEMTGKAFRLIGWGGRRKEAVFKFVIQNDTDVEGIEQHEEIDAESPEP